MTVRTLSHPGRRPHAGYLAAAAGAWLEIIAGAFLIEVLWRGLRASAGESPAAEWPDGIIVSAVVLVLTWIHLHEQEGRPGPSHLAAIGALWVFLSVILEYAYRLYAVDHYAMRFLINMFMGDYRGSNGWLWDLFLAVQLCAPLFLGILRGSLSQRRMKHWTPYL